MSCSVPRRPCIVAGRYQSITLIRESLCSSPSHFGRQLIRAYRSESVCRAILSGGSCSFMFIHEFHKVQKCAAHVSESLTSRYLAGVSEQPVLPQVTTKTAGVTALPLVFGRRQRNDGGRGRPASNVRREVSVCFSASASVFCQHLWKSSWRGSRALCRRAGVGG